MWQPPITMKTAVTIAALAVATIVASPPTNRSASPELVQHGGSESLANLLVRPGFAAMRMNYGPIRHRQMLGTPWAFARATGHVIGAIGSAPRNVRSLPLRPVRASPVALPQSPTASVLMTGCRTSATWYAMPSQRSIGASPAPANAFRQVSPTRLHGL